MKRNSWKSIGCRVFVSLAILTSMILTLPCDQTRNIAIAGGSGTPWCDRYGFDGNGGYNLDTWHAFGVHSGVKEAWNSGNPSIDYTICSHAPVWQGSCYMNVSNVYPNAFLNGNAMFIIAGHGEKDYMLFYGNTYVYDSINNCPGNRVSSSIFINDSSFNLDYMALAFLGSCRSAQDEDGLAYWMRCVKGVDNVIGFNVDILNLQADEFQERFFCYTISLGQTIRNSTNYALADLIDQFGFTNLGGLNSVELWCRDNPNGGNEKIWYPRWGSPG